MKRIFSLIAVLLFASVTGFSQKQSEPLQSPRAYVKTNHLDISYGQPSKRNRDIFGGLVPYGQVWRTGANEATEITFKNVTVIKGTTIKPGTYTLFTIPEKDEWTIILNQQLKQWGAFAYEANKNKDVMHVKVPVKHLNTVTEKFTITADDHGMTMTWDKTSVTVPMEFK